MSDAGAGLARWVNGATPASRLLLIATVCGALAAVPPATLDRLPHFCLWERLFGYCPAHGTAHALCALLHGDPAGALRYNANIVLLAPLLGYVVVSDVWRVLARRPHV